MKRKSGKKTTRIGLTYDLRSDYLAEGFPLETVAEFDMDSTIDGIEQAIQSLGYSTDRIGHARHLCARLVKGDRWDLVFNIAEGMHGRSREAQVPAMLDIYGIPYTFSDPLTCAVTLDKAVAKRIVASFGINTPLFTVVSSPDDTRRVKLRYPLFAKPLAEGTGKGIDSASLAASPADLASTCARLLRRFHQPVLVEEYLPGREFTVGITGTGNNAKVVGTMEILVMPVTGQKIYSFEMKEKCDDFVRYAPLRNRNLRKSVEKHALQAYRALECRDAGRVDVRLDSAGKPSFMELNPLPGMHPMHSDLPMIATQEGMSYRQLVNAIITSALARSR